MFLLIFRLLKVISSKKISSYAKKLKLKINGGMMWSADDRKSTVIYQRGERKSVLSIVYSKEEFRF